MTLLKNSNGTLPLKASQMKTLAIVGPQAKMAGLLMGNYAESAANGNWGTDVFDAVTARVNGSGVSISYAAGCADINCQGTEGFAEAVASVKGADAVIVTLGLGFNMQG